MKHILPLLFTCLTVLNANAQKSKITTYYVHEYIDVFNQHIKILDSIIKHCYDNAHISNGSISYMERVTHIKAHGEGDWGGLRPFTWLDLSLWKTWYKNIGSKRIGIIK